MILEFDPEACDSIQNCEERTFVEIKKFERDIQLDLNGGGTKCKRWRYGDKVVREYTCVKLYQWHGHPRGAQAFNVFNVQHSTAQQIL
jgi:hypothetical protein